jgi:T-box
MSLPFDPIFAAAFHELRRQDLPSPYELDNLPSVLRHPYDIDNHFRSMDDFARRLSSSSIGDSTRWRTLQRHHHPCLPPSLTLSAGEISAEQDSSLTEDPSGNRFTVRAELEGLDLWEKFDAHCTEMVITKSGRYADHKLVYIFTNRPNLNIFSQT